MNAEWNTIQRLLDEIDRGAEGRVPMVAGQAIDARVTAALERVLKLAGWHEIGRQGGSFGLIGMHMLGSPGHRPATVTQAGQGREVWIQKQLPLPKPYSHHQIDILFIDHDARTLSFTDNTRGAKSGAHRDTRHDVGKFKYLRNPEVLKFRKLGYSLLSFNFPGWEETRRELRG